AQRLNDVREAAAAAARALERYRAEVAEDAEFLRRARESSLDLARGLIGHFSFDAIDSIGEGDVIVPNETNPRNPGRFRGTPVIVPGVRSSAFEVREGALASVPEDFAFDRSDAFSFSLWVHAAEARPRSPLVVRALAD